MHISGPQPRAGELETDSRKLTAKYVFTSSPGGSHAQWCFRTTILNDRYQQILSEKLDISALHASCSGFQLFLLE